MQSNIDISQHADEWNNFMERLNCKKDSEIWENDENILQLRHWVSLRGQTLCRTGIKCFILSRLIFEYQCVVLTNFGITVRGMMYYRRALKLQAFLDMANENGKTKYFKNQGLAQHANSRAFIHYSLCFMHFFVLNFVHKNGTSFLLKNGCFSSLTIYSPV